MVFNSPGVVIFVLVVLVLWLAAMTFVLFGALRHYNSLVKGNSGHGLKAILEQLLIKQQQVGSRVTQLEASLETMSQNEELHIQRVGIVRFNPFADTGGSQSFALALLDGRDNGVVMTSLYARAGSRWYIKSVRSGKGSDVDLSKEESNAVSLARPVGTA